MTRFGFILSFIIAVAGATGCSPFKDKTTTCRINPAYIDATLSIPLKVPEGLAEPDLGMAMPVPQGPRQAVVKTNDGFCLERPPRYFAQPGAPNPDGLPVARLAMAEPDPLALDPGRAPAASGSPDQLIPGASILTNRIAQFLVEWAAIWSQRDPDEYFMFYVGDFAPAGYQDHADWVNTQRERFTFPAVTRIELESLEVEIQADGNTKAVFVQQFGEAPNLRSVLKEVILIDGGPAKWQISSERILDVL